MLTVSSSVYIVAVKMIQLMKIVVIAIIGRGYYLAAAQDKVCSAFCSSLGMLQSNPGKSCSDIYQINTAVRGLSGNYSINTTDGVEQVYCDMELECGGHKGGWMRIADFDASRGDDCPLGWNKITYPVAACIASSSDAGCYSTNFSTLNVTYRKVCGMAIGYQKASTDGFAAFVSGGSINGPYVDGISITYGEPRKHIWTYGIGNSEIRNDLPSNLTNCPCSEFPGPLPPSFVHDHYYCESGSLYAGRGYHITDPVWDGEDCSVNNNCCSDPNLPWFYRQIPLTTSEDIEIRICRDESSYNEDVLIKELQLYIQ